jgi:hypothetical protein
VGNTPNRFGVDFGVDAPSPEEQAGCRDPSGTDDETR